MKLRVRSWLLGAALVAGAAGLRATPAQVIFLRHAEKPDSGTELSERGRARAQALATLFTHDPRVLEHGPAVAVFVMKPAKYSSIRAVETMFPTGQALHVPLKNNYFREDIDGLAHALLNPKKYNGGTVIVCWEHNQIPEMLKALGWTEGPPRWRDQDYDRLWILDLEAGKPVRFRDLPQRLLPGDAEK